VLAQVSPVRVFIGSSSEGQAIAAHLQHELESRNICEAELWPDIFEPSGYALPSLINAAAAVDFAVLIATPDDTTISRGEERVAMRDNIILEFGLFAGALGLERTYLLPTGKVSLPSDVLGLTHLPYRARSDNNIGAALNSAVLALSRQVDTLGRRGDASPSGLGTKTADGAYWKAAVDAVHRLIGFDPAAEPVGERLTDLRIGFVSLIDELDDWDGLDAWLAAEHGLGAVLGRQVMERARPTDTPDQRLKVLSPYHLWAQALASNLRHFRRRGYEAAVMSDLQKHAEQHKEEVYRANGWSMPPTTPPGVEPLEH
jgi:Predicted nucleotide-binding protein containing TIR-like domain